MNRVRVVRALSRVARGWIAIELAAGIVALCICVTFLPAIAVLLALPAQWSLQAALGVTVNSGATAVLLGRHSLGLPRELLTSR